MVLEHSSSDESGPDDPPGSRIGAVLACLALDPQVLSLARHRAGINGTGLDDELLVMEAIDESGLACAIADVLGLPVMLTIDADRVRPTGGLDSQLVRPVLLRIEVDDGPALIARALRLDDLEGRQPEIEALAASGRLVVTTRTAIRNAVWAVGADARLRRAVGRLFEESPPHSARFVLLGGQGLMAGGILGLLGAVIIAWPVGSLFVIHAMLTAFYLCSLLPRLGSLFLARPPERRDLPVETTLPVYSVLIPLHREAAIVPQLLARIGMLDWPRSLLDVKIVCEADDTSTIAALRAANPPPHVEIVEVPPGKPRTKPKALLYALAGARGDYLVIYDAEDKPQPGQLREAWEAFRRGGEMLACVQAPLLVENAANGIVPALFALEYAALFRSLLPFLARFGLPLPLGGTSNHFRRHALEAVGAWDPYNVTEDADLGLRLARLGMKTGTVSRQTLEAAPEDVRTWIGQRSRWFKGWMQTWLVLMRNPVRLMVETGWAGGITFHLLITAMLVAALTHPLMLLVLLMPLLWWAGLVIWNPADLVLFILDVSNLVLSYGLMIALGYRAMMPTEWKGVGWRVLALPVYWLLMTFAAWKAFAQLFYNPHHWDKTAHKPTSRSNGEIPQKAEAADFGAEELERVKGIEPSS